MAANRVLDENLLDDLVILENIKRKRDKKIELMLISDNEEIKKLHYYIFSSVDDVEYYTLEDLSPEDISLLYEMDIIIFNKNDEELKESILQIIKSQKLDLKFFEISKKQYIRNKDMLIAHNSGVHKLFSRDFMLEDFIMNIEIFLKTNFYTKRLIALKENKEITIESKELFENRVFELINKKIFFSLLKFSYDSDTDIKNYNLQKIVREYDTIYFDKKRKILHFLILNTIPSFGKKSIKKRVENFSISVEPLEALSAFELVYEDN
ncbi:MAG: hypothetical protein DSZ06_02300 [Sulfurospirillum sp.]|nr:MAG: hypothetical protein DSZ06_02300 [Sulfurospirillum sp.]